MRVPINSETRKGPAQNENTAGSTNDQGDAVDRDSQLQVLDLAQQEFDCRLRFGLELILLVCWQFCNYLTQPGLHSRNHLGSAKHKVKKLQRINLAVVKALSCSVLAFAKAARAIVGLKQFDATAPEQNR